MTPAVATHPPLRPVRERPEEPRSVKLAANEVMLLVTAVCCVAIAYAFPFRSVKYGLIVFFGTLLLLQTVRRPAIGMAMLVFAAPAMDLLPQTLLPIRGFNVETAMILFLLFLWGRANMMYGRDTARTTLGRFVLAYVLMILLSSVHTWLLFRVSLFDILAKAKNHLSWMLYLPVAFHTLRTPRDQKLCFGASVLSIFLVSVQAINNHWLAFVAGTLDRHRAGSLLAPQPNIFGGALAMYLPVLAVMTINASGPRLVRFWYAICSVACGFALILTLSRGAWLGAVAGLLVVAMFRNWKLLALLVLLAATWQLWVPQAAIDRVQMTTKAEGDLGAEDQIADDSTQMRIEQYRSLPAMMAPHPIVGWGYKSFPRIFQKYGTLGIVKGAHSTYCQIATEEGIVGLVVLAALFFAMAMTGIRAYKDAEDPFHRWLGVGVLGATVSMALCMATGARFEAQKVFVYFWVFAGVVEREAIFGFAGRAPRGPRPLDAAPRPAWDARP
ncbi:MAG: O-antigen ligase family protein [Acidobacteria bacterium]|nr:MAG: O-antigen ligase family protein [Acidobacteriota bacterium]